MIGAKVVENVKAGVIILLPLGKSKAAIANKQADEPELTNTPYFLPNSLAIFFSNSTERGPNPANHPSRRHCSTIIIILFFLSFYCFGVL
jgi:hypothetical protein